jgi:hypothetical protein
VLEIEELLGLTAVQRARILWRLDGGFGSDGNLNWLLKRGYQVLTKGYAGRRAKTQGQKVMAGQWQLVEGRTDKWWAPTPQPVRYYRRTQSIVVRWAVKGNRYRYALLLSTLPQLAGAALSRAYDGRGAMESEIKGDKGGLNLERRRKKQLAAQEALVLLTDLAHNLVAGLRREMLADSPFADYGPYRIVKELLCIPGKAVVKDGELVQLRLWQSHPHSALILPCLERLLG